MGNPIDTDDQGAGSAFPIAFTMAFQPIIDATDGRVFAHEALVRGVDGAGAGAVLQHMTPGNRYAFDQDSRVVAIRLAGRLGLAAPDATALVSINFLPNAILEPALDISSTVMACEQTGMPHNRILFEFTEHEPIDPGHLQSILKTYRGMGFRTAIDDFGAGYSGLTLLSRFQPDVVKLDMALVRCIDVDRVKRAIVSHLVRLAADLGVAVVAEGIETLAEYETLRDIGVNLLQGYLFAKPAFEALAAPHWPTAIRKPRAA
ncbi:MAG: EAL domain-containing protein [Pseudomonadota bacterium]|nr:EAL domain-containing protein [Pseudomonadota bacterium]